jgi:hypothetical protein
LEKKTDKAAGTQPARVKSTINTDTVTNVEFKAFWEKFKLAVKKNNIPAIIQLTHFPIHNLHPCYLPTPGETRTTDTAGLSPADFKTISKKIFDDETSWLTSTPADSLYTYNKREDDKNLLLENMVDPKTVVYEYAVVYDQDRSGGTKNLYFGSIKGHYKLIWIECEGNITGHSH